MTGCDSCGEELPVLVLVQSNSYGQRHFCPGCLCARHPKMARMLLSSLWPNVRREAASWQAGNTAAYDEEAVRVAFEESKDAMRRHLEALLAPILERRAS